MTDEDIDTANAALLMDEKIAARIEHAITTDPGVAIALRSRIQYEIQQAFHQFAARVQPQYVTTSSYSSGTGQNPPPGIQKYYW